jgi:Fe-Mn family superoxide dismutase
MFPSRDDAPAGALADRSCDFGSLEQLKVWFAEAGEQGLYPDGFGLRTQPLGKLQVVSTFGHENPLLQGHYPILVNDVWERLLLEVSKPLSRCEEWWAVINWKEAGLRYEPDRPSRMIGGRNGSVSGPST